MSALTDRIAAEHGGWFNLDGVWRCNCGEPLPSSANADMWMRAHVAAVTEAAVREQVAREIEEAEVWAVRTDLLDRWGTSLGGRRIMSPHRAHMIVQLVRADAARIARGGVA